MLKKFGLIGDCNIFVVTNNVLTNIMNKIIALGASNSRKSINKDFAAWAATQIGNAEIEVLDLNNFEMPIYGIDRETESGIPQLALDFKNKVKTADAIIISYAEHNGSYSAAFKNIIDWVSRIEKGIWANKPALLLATSPGPRGAIGVLNAATSAFPHHGGQLIGSFSLPSFYQNFKAGILDESLATQFQNEISKLQQFLDEKTVEKTPVGV